MARNGLAGLTGKASFAFEVLGSGINGMENFKNLFAPRRVTIKKVDNEKDNHG